MGRSPCCDKTKVKRGSWSPEEDATLKKYLHEHGTGGNWIALPQKAGLKRCGKSCRLRWLNYLRPDIKHGAFTAEEENTIFSIYNMIGSRWSVIASRLPGRTDNDVKNYWNTKLKKKLMAEHTSISTTPNIPSAASGTATTTTVAAMDFGETTTFLASPNIPATSIDQTYSTPFLPNISATSQNVDNDHVIPFEPIGWTTPRFDLERPNSIPNTCNITLSSPSHQDLSIFTPSSSEMDEKYGLGGIPMEEHSYQDLSGIWPEMEVYINAEFYQQFPC